MRAHGKAEPYRYVRRHSRNSFSTAGTISMLPFKLRRLVFASLLIFSVFSATLMAQKRKTVVDLIVRGGTVVTMDGTRRLIESGGVAIKGGRIVAVDTTANIDRNYAAREV